MQFLDAKGAHIPILGLGTWTLRGRDCAHLVEQAIRLGYRHIDTAQMYGNEREVGEGIRASGIKREEVFVTTKVAPDNLGPRLLERSVKDLAGALQLGEIDLLLLHWPNKGVPLTDTIAALVGAKRDGLVRNIGVSNYTVALVEEASRLSGEQLVCNQIEYHPVSRPDQGDRRPAAGMAWRSWPIRRLPRASTKNDAVLTRIGKAHGKPAAQVSLRWLIQQGVGAIPRTSKVERLAENIAIFDFELSAQEMREIAGLARSDGRLTDWAWSPKWD